MVQSSRFRGAGAGVKEQVMVLAQVQRCRYRCAEVLRCSLYKGAEVCQAVAPGFSCVILR